MGPFLVVLGGALSLPSIGGRGGAVRTTTGGAHRRRRPRHALQSG
ncbi:hypothetical protein [Sinomonas sp. P47F7]